jgi:thioredoxin reductase
MDIIHATMRNLDKSTRIKETAKKGSRLPSGAKIRGRHTHHQGHATCPISAHTIVIATGAEYRKPELKNLSRFEGAKNCTIDYFPRGYRKM